MSDGHSEAAKNTRAAQIVKVMATITLGEHRSTIHACGKEPPCALQYGTGDERMPTECPRGPTHKWIPNDVPYEYSCELCGETMKRVTEETLPMKTSPSPGLSTRISWPETWMKVAQTLAERSYDPRLKVGAIVVSSDNTLVLSVGYNGNYRGGPHVHESPEPGKSGFIHAEVNALVKCDFNFPKSKHMYVTHSPCRDCSKLIINAGIERVVFDHPYRDTSGIELLRSMGVKVFPIKDAINYATIPKR